MSILVFIAGCQNLPQLTEPTAIQASPTPAESPTRVPVLTALPATKSTPTPVDLKGRAIKVGSDTTYAPFESVNDKGEIVGFDVDLVNEICKKINCKATFITADFDSLLPAIQNKTYDISASGWITTNDRAKIVDFSLPYMRNTQVLLVRAGETAVKEVEDLKKPDVIVAVQQNTTMAITAKQLVADPKQVKEYQNFPEAVQALINKRATVVIVDTFGAADLLDQNNGKIKATGKQFGNETLGLVFRKDNTELKSAFDMGLKAVFQDGTWSKLCAKWWQDAILKPDCTGASLPLGK